MGHLPVALGGPVLAGHRILVVADEYLLTDELDGALRRAGAVVLGPVPTVEAALELLETDEAPDAAVLDVNLGGEMTHPVANALASRGAPFLFATGYERSALPDHHAAVRRPERPVETCVVRRELGRLLDPAS